MAEKVFTACRRGLEVYGREISMSRLVIRQLRWEAVDRLDLTPPTQFMTVLNFYFLGSFHRIECVGCESATTWVAQNYLLFVHYMARIIDNFERPKWLLTHHLRILCGENYLESKNVKPS